MDINENRPASEQERKTAYNPKGATWFFVAMGVLLTLIVVADHFMTR